MSFSTTTALVSYSGDASTLEFSVTFPFQFSDELAVIVTTAGVDETQVLNTDYTVGGAGQDSGGTVRFMAAPATGTTVTIHRNLDLNQERSFAYNGAFPTATVASSVDKAMQGLQQINEKLKRTFRISESNADISPLSVADRAGKVTGFNDEGLPTLFTPVITAFPYAAPYSISTVASLKAASYSDVPTGTQVYVTQYSDAGDGGGGVFYVDKLDTASADNGGTIFVSLDGTRIKRIFDGRINLLWFGAKGDGITDNSSQVSLWLADQKVQSKGGYAPSGQYLLNSAVTISNCDLDVTGDGQEKTVFIVGNTTGGIFYTSTGNGTVRDHMIRFAAMTFAPSGSGAVSRGKALSAIYPTTSAAPATPTVIFEDICIRGKEYVVSPSADPFFTNGIYIENAANTRIDNINTSQNSNTSFTAIHLNNSITAFAFRATISRVNLQGGNYGIRLSESIEDVQIDEFEIASPRYGIHADASGLGFKTPVLCIGRGHVNATNRGIHVKNWKSIIVTGVEVAVVNHSTTTDATIYGHYYEGVDFLTVNGGHVNNINDSGSATTMLLIGLLNVTGFSLGGITGRLIFDSGVTQRGISITNSSKQGTVIGNAFEGQGSTPESFIFIQTNLAANEKITISNNQATGFTYGLLLIDAFGVKATDNDFTGCATPINLLGTQNAATVIERNHPASARQAFADLDATPSVAGVIDGLCTTNNSAATTITNFDNPRDRQVIEILAGNSNTTIQHNASIILNGSVDFVMGAASMLVLRYTSSAWRELSRRA